MTDEMKIKFADFSEEVLEHDTKSLDCLGANGTV